MPLSILNHVLIEKDILMCIVPLIESKPWLRRTDKGKREKWEESKWMEVPAHEFSRIPKIEGQLWIAIYNLLMTKESAERYEITDYRKGTLLRVR
jgi:zinc finger MYND domain-containing protein 10